MTNLYAPTWISLRLPKLGREIGSADLAAIWEKGTQVVLSLLIVTILVGFTGGVIKTFLGLHLLWTADVESGRRSLIVNESGLRSRRSYDHC